VKVSDEEDNAFEENNAGAATVFGSSIASHTCQCESVEAGTIVLQCQH
jgi:hypothetical protein